MKVDTLLKNVGKSYDKHLAACRELTRYVIDNVVEDVDDYEFYSFAVFSSSADGIALEMEIEEDKKQKIDSYYKKGIKICDIVGVIDTYKQEKRKVTIKEIFERSF